MTDPGNFYKRLWPQARVLDVGSGAGALTAQIAQVARTGYVLGVDSDPQAVAQATRAFSPEQYPNLRFRVADARVLDLDEAPFDFVVSQGCLHYLPHPGQAFGAIAKHLKPEGRMEVWSLGQGNAMRITRALKRLTDQPRWRPHFQDYDPQWGMVSPASCDASLKEAGLAKIYGGLVNQRMSFDTSGEFLQWFGLNWRPYLERVPLDAELFLQEFLRLYSPCGKPPFTAQLVWLGIQAIKRRGA